MNRNLVSDFARRTLSRREFVACLPFALAHAAPARLTVMSYNIHHGEGTDGRIDLERIAAIIRAARPELVAVQEVDRATERSGGVDQLVELGRLTGMRHFFGKTIDYQGGQYGNAILASIPVVEERRDPLPGREPRGVLSVRTESGFWFLATHLDVGRDEAVRVESAGRLNGHPGVPAILAGDLNAQRTSGTLARLLEQWTIAGDEIPTIPSKAPARQIDFVLYRPAPAWRVVEVRVPEEAVASDHRPIVAVLEGPGRVSAEARKARGGKSGDRFAEKP